MKQLRSIGIVAAIMLFAGCVWAQAARVTKGELPQPVLETIDKESAGSTFVSATRQQESDGSEKYAVNVKQGEERIRLIIARDGKLYERSENAKFSELPARLKKKIEHVCSGEPDAVTKITHADGQAIYKFTAGRLMDEDGSRRPKGQDDLGGIGNIPNEEVPQPVLKTIESLTSGTDWFAIKLGGEHAKYGSSYMITTSTRKFFVIAPDGRLNESWDMNVSIADLPRPVRKIAERAKGAGEMTLIEVKAPGKKPYYRLALNAAVREDGRILMEHEQY